MLESYPHHCKFFLVKCIISYRNNIYVTNFLKYTSFQLNLLLSSHYLPFIIVSKNEIRLELYIFRSYNERITNKYCIFLNFYISSVNSWAWTSVLRSCCEYILRNKRKNESVSQRRWEKSNWIFECLLRFDWMNRCKGKEVCYNF